jgi:hypothetical protein
MIAHILGKSGKNPCPNASEDARKTASDEKKGKGKKNRRGRAQAAAVKMTERRNELEGSGDDFDG